jgi:hypothetical protein
MIISVTDHKSLEGTFPWRRKEQNLQAYMGTTLGCLNCCAAVQTPDNDINSADSGEHAIQVKVDNNKLTIRCCGGNGPLVSNMLQQIDVSGSK